MKRYALLLVVFLALAACISNGDTPPAASTALSTSASVAGAAPSAAITAAPTGAPPAPATDALTVTPTLDPTIERPDTPAPPLTPVPSATPGPSGFAPPAPVPGFDDGLVLIANDGSVIIYTPSTGRVETLFGPNTYRMGSFDGPDPIWLPPRLSPDGRRLLLPRVSDTWLAERAAPGGTTSRATAAPLIAERLWATWAPDSRRVVYAATEPGMQDFGGGQIYVQDIAGGEPRLLTTLPSDAFWAIWSPGCAADDTSGDCGRSIAALGSGDDSIGLAVWVIDSETGEARELGRFDPPNIDLTTWLRWTADETGLIGRADGYDIFFPLDGGAARPLVVETGAATAYGHVAPDGSSYLRLEYSASDTTRLVFGRLAAGDEVAAPGPYERVVVEGWTSDSRFVVLSAVVDGVGGLYAIDLAGWPVVGEPVFLATDAYLLGLEWQMAQRATVAEARPWATTEPPLPAGPVGTWIRHDWPAANLQVAAPAGWRFEVREPYGDAVLANYAATSYGLVALSDEQLRVELSWSYTTAGDLPPFSVEGMQSTFFEHDVAAVIIGDVTGARLTGKVSPECEQLVFPHHDGQRRGELWLTYCPATEQWRAFMAEFVAQLGLTAAAAP